MPQNIAASGKKEKAKQEKRRREGPLQWRIFGYLLGFTALLLSLLWLVQTVYLNEFYTRIKILQINGTADIIGHNIDNEDVTSLLVRLAQNQEMFISIYNLTALQEGREGEIMLYNVDVLPDCLIHRMLDIDVARLYNQAVAAGATYTEIFSRDFFRNRAYNAGLFRGPVPGPDRGLGESMVLSHVFNNAAGDEILLLLNTNITPLDATVSTLRVQLRYITLIMVLAALILSLIIARYLSAPIKRINASAKQLAQGEFACRFDGKGYRETGELADTLNYAAAELSRAERLQRELIANISHDLRTPLTMIGGYAEMMRDLPTENNRENTQVIIDEVGRLSSLVNNVLDLSKLQAGVEHFALREFDLRETLEGIVENYRRLSAPQGYIINLESAGEAWVYADESKLSQVIYNFINNALTYTGADKTVTARLLLLPGKVRVEIADSGAGIAPERIKDIWQRYWRDDGAHKRAAHGSGLGLAIAREVLERHEAAYGVESTVGQGSVFWFEVPRIGA
ncbi:MAG: HAMP domain-containing histidine kinase [Clostridiales bacterium]|nr:HAMP domain-containing histidine kinase [Clostridiales bacterium]